MNRLGKYLEALSKVDPEKLERLAWNVRHFKNIILLGNGGSNAIATHFAQDFTKRLSRNGISFSDPIRLSCYANDYGWENAYQKFLMENWGKSTYTILISSSGESKNILKCQEFLEDKIAPHAIMTGFGVDNTLHKKAGLGVDCFNVDSQDYGVIESTHNMILHSIV